MVSYNAVWTGLFANWLSPRTTLYNHGVSGTSTWDWAAGTYTADAIAGDTPLDLVMVDLGAREMYDHDLRTEAEWVTAIEKIVDAVHTHSPAAIVYLMRDWIRGSDADADTLAARIDLVVAARSSFVRLGSDGRIWIKGSDDGASETVDGIHYTNPGAPGLGQTLCAIYTLAAVQ